MHLNPPHPRAASLGCGFGDRALLGLRSGGKDAWGWQDRARSPATSSRGFLPANECASRDPEPGLAPRFEAVPGPRGMKSPPGCACPLPAASQGAQGWVLSAPGAGSGLPQPLPAARHGKGACESSSRERQKWDKPSQHIKQQLVFTGANYRENLRLMWISQAEVERFPCPGGRRRGRLSPPSPLTEACASPAVPTGDAAAFISEDVPSKKVRY